MIKDDLKKEIFVKKRNGRLEELNLNKINKVVERACQDLTDVSSSEIILDAQIKLFDKVKTTEIDEALISSAAEKICKDPNYSFVAARLFLATIYKDVLKESVDSDTFLIDYKTQFIKNIKKVIKIGYFTDKLLGYDLNKISEALIPENDFRLKYLGVRTLADRYLFRHESILYETPQYLFMRVAMGLCLNEKNKEEEAIKLYRIYSNLFALPATPVLFNSGKIHSQTSSCFLNIVSDSIDGIFDSLHQEARKSKWAGGLGMSVTPLRSTGSNIKGTNGKSSGLVPWLKLYEATVVAVNQGGNRPGAMAVYLEPWHLDYHAFLELRRVNGDEWQRTHNLNTASWIPDEFMKRVKEDKDWYFFCPAEFPELHEKYGEEFSKLYHKAISKAEKGEVKFKKEKAKDVWKKQLKMLFETGFPWNCFTGETKIAVADGRNSVSIKELADNNQKFPVYSARKNLKKNIPKTERYWIEEIKWATAFRTGVRNVIEIGLDDGSSFKCTPEHLIALKDGGYESAELLKIGQSLAPFNAYQDQVKSNNIYIGLNGAVQNRQARLIWEFFNGTVPTGFAVDHKINGAGDSLNNLQLMSVKEHNQKTATERLGDKNPFFGKKHSDSFKKEASLRIQKMMTPEYREFLSKSQKGIKKKDRYGFSKEDLILMGRKFFTKFGSISNKKWKKEFKSEQLPSAGYIANRFPSWNDFTSSCIKNHKVSYIKNMGEEEVYDITVEDNHNFFIITQESDLQKSGILVHNCFKDPSNIRYSNSHSGVVHSSNLCVSGDTLIDILVDNRYLKIEIKDLDYYINIYKEVLIKSYDLERKIVHYKPVVEFAQTGESEEIIEIEDERGNILRCTPEHQIYTKNRGFVGAGGLIESDILLNE